MNRITRMFYLGLSTMCLIMTTRAISCLLAFLKQRLILSILVDDGLPMRILFQCLLTRLLLNARALQGKRRQRSEAVISTMSFRLVRCFRNVQRHLKRVDRRFIRFLTNLRPLLLKMTRTIEVIRILTNNSTRRVIIHLNDLLVLRITIINTCRLSTMFPNGLSRRLIHLLLRFMDLTINRRTQVVKRLITLRLRMVIVTRRVIVPLTYLANSNSVTLRSLN